MTSIVPSVFAKPPEHHSPSATHPLICRPKLLLIGYASFLLISTVILQRASSHSTSRLATIESLVSRHSFSIDSSIYSNTIDRVRINGHYYSHQPPAFAIIGAAVYYPLHSIGLRFSPGRNLAYPLVAFAVSGISTLLALVAFFHSLRQRGVRYLPRIAITACLACGTLVLPFSTTLNVHILVAAWLFIGFSWLLRAANSDHQRGWFFLSGLAFSFCVALDHTTALFYIAFAVYVVIISKRRIYALFFLAAATLTIVPTLAYYQIIGGSIKPFAMRTELFDFPGSIWTGPNRPSQRILTGELWNSPFFALRYGFLCLFGPRGFLVYNLPIWIALWGMIQAIRRRMPYWREAIAIGAASAVMMIYFFFASVNFSGSSYSIRWFVPVLFLWAFFSPAASKLFTAAYRSHLRLLAVISILIALAGVCNPWPPPTWGYMMPLANVWSTIKEFRQAILL